MVDGRREIGEAMPGFAKVGSRPGSLESGSRKPGRAHGDHPVRDLDIGRRVPATPPPLRPACPSRGRGFVDGAARVDRAARGEGATRTGSGGVTATMSARAGCRGVAAIWANEVSCPAPGSRRRWRPRVARASRRTVAPRRGRSRCPRRSSRSDAAMDPCPRSRACSARSASYPPPQRRLESGLEVAAVVDQRLRRDTDPQLVRQIGRGQEVARRSSAGSMPSSAQAIHDAVHREHGLGATRAAIGRVRRLVVTTPSTRRRDSPRDAGPAGAPPYCRQHDAPEL